MVEAVAGEKYDLVAAECALHERAAGQAVRCADNFAVGNVHFGQAGESAAADDGDHELGFLSVGGMLL